MFRILLAFLICGGMVMTSVGDEGMWLFSHPPRKILQDKYQVTLSDEWLRHLQLASVRLNNGGSGSFVSPHGLLLTNHHVGADALQKLSPPNQDYYSNGYTARSPQEELKCPDLEVNVLIEMEDVTAKVNAAVKPDMNAGQSNAARRAAMAAIEKESLDKTGLRSDVVTLYQGGQYHLYRYKKFTDVRLVFAPEKDIASFGGDVDNFEYPRFNLDICFFRVYENGKPYESKEYLKWSANGPQPDELVFVSGHPGTTQRLETYERLRFRRDVLLPYTLTRLRNREANLIQFGERSPEHRKWVQKDFYSTANARKAFSGQYQGLLDATILETKRKQEEELLKSLSASNQNHDVAQVQKAIETIRQSQSALRGFYHGWSMLETGDAFDSVLFKIARDLVRLNTEKAKPNGERLREYRDSALSSLELQLFSPAPLYPELEHSKLAASLTFFAEQLGGEHPLVKQVLQGQSPANRAGELVHSSKLFDVDERKRLAGSKSALQESQDPMILLVKSIDEEARKFRKQHEETVEEPERQAYSAIAQARFKVYETQLAPDATFTLRLAFGTVKGYQVNGRTLPYCTTFQGVFDREKENAGKPPFQLSSRWLEGKSKLKLDTPFNFVSTADTIGGNSGSPVVNLKGEFVGINFDRNRHGLVRNFVYTDVQARHIAVHSSAIIEAMRKLYDVKPLLQELGMNQE
ncbi:MAG: S46 family peptidase [Planctomycetia bacterium]|nr:S46 family peptidase [Planctomycetia bacterium]